MKQKENRASVGVIAHSKLKRKQSTGKVVNYDQGFLSSDWSKLNLIVTQVTNVVRLFSIMYIIQS